MVLERARATFSFSALRLAFLRGKEEICSGPSHVIDRFEGRAP